MRRIAPLLLVAALAGCASRPSLERLDPSPRAAVSPERVEVLADAPARPHRVIARWAVQARASDKAEMRRQAVAEAARLGADAVVLRSRLHVDAQMRAGNPAELVASPLQTRTRLTAELLVWDAS